MIGANILGFATDAVPPFTHADYRKDERLAIRFPEWQKAGQNPNQQVSEAIKKWGDFAKAAGVPKNIVDPLWKPDERH